jgi:hypothetical protein
MDQMQRDFEQFLSALKEHVAAQLDDDDRLSNALVPLRSRPVFAIKRPHDE